MTKEHYKEWLERLVHIWETKNPNAVLDLVAEKFIWHEAPFEKPITTKEDLLQEWQTILNHEEINVTYEIYTVEDNVGIAHWRATFTRVPSKEKARLDGIYKVTLDEEGKCTEFHQWYNSTPQERR
ncbi:MAG: nuclear transport factor 2 family protein [Candidatus Spechtbacterales bacterium]